MAHPPPTPTAMLPHLQHFATDCRAVITLGGTVKTRLIRRRLSHNHCRTVMPKL